MSEQARGPEAEYSRGRQGSRGAQSGGSRGAETLPLLLLWGALAIAAAGVVLLVVAEFSPLIQVKVLTAVVDVQKGHDRHSYALVLLGLLALVMITGVARNASRPAMAALVVIGLIAAGIALIGDLPDLDQVGVYGDRYEQAAASARSGFYLETLGAALLIVAGAAMLTLTAPQRPERPRRERPPTDGA